MQRNNRHGRKNRVQKSTLTYSSTITLHGKTTIAQGQETREVAPTFFAFFRARARFTMPSCDCPDNLRRSPSVFRSCRRRWRSCSCIAASWREYNLQYSSMMARQKVSASQASTNINKLNTTPPQACTGHKHKQQQQQPSRRHVCVVEGG